MYDSNDDSDYYQLSGDEQRYIRRLEDEVDTLRDEANRSKREIRLLSLEFGDRREPHYLLGSSDWELGERLWSSDNEELGREKVALMER